MFDYKKRLRYLRKILSQKSVEAFLVTDETNVTYLSGFEGSDSLILVTPDSQFFLTDSRYTEEAAQTVRGFNIVEVTSSLYGEIGSILKKGRIKKMGFESMNLPFEVAKRLEGLIRPTRLLPIRNAVEALRVVKDAEEIACIKKSVSLAKDIMRYVMGEVRPGKSEKYLSGLAECAFLKKGAKVAFEPIVACGKNSSKPHAHPGSAKVWKNDFVMVDIGCNLNHYNSDMTRMALTGKVKDKFKEIYSIVRTAQEKAFSAVRPDAKASEVDAAGRGHINKKGYGKLFGHSLGHGIGMGVHEEPNISARSTDILRPGMVFTVEPAIYIPGFGGVRIEDMVLVTKNGREILTR